MKWQRDAATIFDRLNDFLAVLAGVCIVFMALAVCGDVLMRFLLSRPLGWVIEFSEYLMVYITFMATAWLLKGEGHVKIDIVLSYLGQAKQALLNATTSIAGAMSCLAVLWYAGRSTWRLFQGGVITEAVIGVPKFLLLGIIALAGLLLFIQFMRRAYGYLESLRKFAKQKTKV